MTRVIWCAAREVVGVDVDDLTDPLVEISGCLMLNSGVGGGGVHCHGGPHGLSQTTSGHAWGVWERALVIANEIEVEAPVAGAPRGNPPMAVPLRMPWRHNPRIELDVQPLYRYPPGTFLRLLRGMEWGAARVVHTHTGEHAPPNTYVIGGSNMLPRELLELTRMNHAPLLDPFIDLDTEYLRYSGWVRSTYAHIVDALSGERLDIMQQCVKLRADGLVLYEEGGAFETISRLTSSDEYARPLLVIGEAASGKSTLARLFLVLCVQQRREPQLVPYLLTTKDLVRIMKQRSLGGDYLDGYLRSVYGPRSRRYTFLKQAILERRVILVLDGVDEVHREREPEPEPNAGPNPKPARTHPSFRPSPRQQCRLWADSTLGTRPNPSRAPLPRSSPSI